MARLNFICVFIVLCKHSVTQMDILKTAVTPYLFFWDKWIKSQNCNLNSSDIKILNFYLDAGVESNVLESITFFDKTKQVSNIVEKLNNGYKLFKTDVVVDFLCTLIHHARKYPDGYNTFLQSPISDLKIPAELLDCLVSFKTYNIQLLVTLYKEEDFCQGLIYKKIVEYQISKKNINKITSLNTV